MAPVEDVTPHLAKTVLDGVPVAYDRRLLRGDPGRLDDDAVARIQAVLRQQDPGLEVRRHPLKAAAGCLELVGEVDALDALALLGPDPADVGLQAAYFAGDPADLSLPPDPTTFSGMPAKEGHPGTSREGVMLLGVDPPARSDDVPAAGRRPVVAVLDTAVREHAWLGPGGGDDAFWSDARHLPGPWAPEPASPEEGDDGRPTHAGHGTFIAGIVRLLAPEARVLSLPVMHADGLVEEDHVLSALAWLRDRVRTAVAENRPELYVDVVNLSFGRYLAPGRDGSGPVRELLDELARLGVRLVASAGNRAVDTPVFPASVADDDTDAPGRTALVSVAALDPDGSLAAYSNFGDWVTLAAPGTALVSALPRFQAGGVGRWGGTSFAAAWVSASLAAKLLQQASPGSLAEVTVEAATRRATAALDAVRADVDRWVGGHGAR